jgi:hypothetical protein
MIANNPYLRGSTNRKFHPNHILITHNLSQPIAWSIHRGVWVKRVSTVYYFQNPPCVFSMNLSQASPFGLSARGYVHVSGL